MAAEKTEGFTLLELIVSLTILGVIVTIVFGAMRVGVRAWEKGERDIEGQQRSRIVLDRIQQQMASMVVPIDMKDADAAKYHLKGDRSSVEFISRVSLMPENRSGLVYVTYAVRTGKDGEQSLSFYEQVLAQRSPEASENTIEDDDFYVLLPHVAECRFEYLKVSTPEGSGKSPNDKGAVTKDVVPDDAGTDENQEFSWETSWDPDAEEQNPRAVGLSLRMDDTSDPIRIIVPIPSEARP